MSCKPNASCASRSVEARSMRSARNRDASTNVMLFISDSACSGVFVRSTCTVHVSRAAALNVIMVGGGIVRRQ